MVNSHEMRQGSRTGLLRGSGCAFRRGEVPETRNAPWDVHKYNITIPKTTGLRGTLTKCWWDTQIVTPKRPVSLR